MLLVTRPREQALSWVKGLRERGIEAAAMPLLSIAPLGADDAEHPVLLQAIGSLSQRQLVVFVSPSAVEHFLVAAASRAGLVWPRGVWAATPGPGSAAALIERGVPADQVLQPAADAPQFDTASLWATLSRHDWSGADVLLVRGQGGREELAQRLEAVGARIQAACAYRRGPPHLSLEESGRLRHAIHHPTDVQWLFSSSEAVAHLPALVGPGFAGWAGRVTAWATHPRIAEQAHRLGLVQTRVCRPGLDDVAAACAAYNAAHRDL